MKLALIIIIVNFFVPIDKLQVLQASIMWKHSTYLPTLASQGNATVINGKVYYGGGLSDDEYLVQCYDQCQSKWISLPSLPIRNFGLGQVDHKLVAVGGKKKRDDKPSNEVYTYDNRSQRWKQTIPPMPTARWFPSVVNLQSALLVIGGVMPSISVSHVAPSYSDAVEIFNPDVSQWYRASQLPIRACNISLAVSDKICYAVGGYNQASCLSQMLYASVDDLIHTAMPNNQSTLYRSGSGTRSAWKTARNSLSFQPTVAVLADKLFVLGGSESSKGGAEVTKMYMYSPSNNLWIYVSDIPVPRSNMTVASLTSTEILVIGGVCGGDQVNSVYKATLSLKL